MLPFSSPPKAVFVLSWAVETFSFEWIENHLESLNGDPAKLPVLYFVDSNPELCFSEKLLNKFKQKCVWIGDADSHAPHLKYFNSENIHQFPVQKSQSDFALALTHFFEGQIEEKHIQQCPTVLVCGVFGGRADHQMCNLLEVAQKLDKSKMKCAFVLDSNCICFSGEIKLELKKNAVFSVFSASNLSSQSLQTAQNSQFGQTVRIAGAKYSGNQILHSPSVGLSNVAVEPLTLTTQAHCVVHLFFQESDLVQLF
jgi:thiamine pyrophosphokinase